MGKPKRDSDEIVDTAAAAARRGGRSFRQRQRGQSDGVRDRNRAVQDKDDELGGVFDGAAGASGPSAGERPSGMDGADNLVNGDRLFADLAGRELAAGHAFDVHVVQRGEYPHVRTRRQFADLIADVIMNGSSRPISQRRTAFWHEGTFVVRNPVDPDGGSAFRPIDGIAYFLRQRRRS